MKTRIFENAPLLSQNGLRLGAGTILLSSILDQEQDNLPDSKSYNQAYTMSLFNLLVIGPFVFQRVAYFYKIY